MNDEPRIPTGAPASSADAALALHDVRKSFGRRRVHTGVTFAVRSGDIMTLAGGSGQGKTVLLKEIIGLERPDSGRILVHGRDVTAMTEDDLQRLRGDVAMVFQGSALFDSMSVGENVAYGLREQKPDLPSEEVRRVVAEKLGMVDLPGIEAMMPAELSGGMKKRVAIARALAIGPSILLYDEPTTGLDPANVRRISAVIRKLRDQIGVTSLIVTHDLDMAQSVTDRLALLDGGRIIAEGRWDDVAASTLPRVRRFLEGDFENPA